MEVYPIVLYGNTILRSKCDDIKVGTDIKEIAEKMFLTMEASHGVGLAAPQVGKNIKMFVANLEYFGENKYGTTKLVVINPELEFPEKNEILEEMEGCLSIPTLSAKVKRYKYVRIKYYNENWEYKDEVYEDWCARVIQHETDHLFQKMYIDYVEKNTEINDILQKIKNGEIVPDYDYVQNINNEFNAV